jgi:hypothetical protein
MLQEVGGVMTGMGGSSSGGATTMGGTGGVDIGIYFWTLTPLLSVKAINSSRPLSKKYNRDGSAPHEVSMDAMFPFAAIKDLVSNVPGIQRGSEGELELVCLKETA